MIGEGIFLSFPSLWFIPNTNMAMSLLSHSPIQWKMKDVSLLVIPFIRFHRCMSQLVMEEANKTLPLEYTSVTNAIM